MTYDAREISQQSGQPIELFEISLGAETWYLTDAEGDQVVLPNTYQAAAITRTSVQLGKETPAEMIEVTLPSDHPFPKQFIENLPSRRASLTVKRLHRDDGATVVIFKGMVQSVAFTTDGSASSIAVLPLQAAQSRQIPRFTFQGLCNHALFDARCKVASSLFKYTGTANAVSGVTVTVPGLGAAKGSNWANGGFVAFGTSEYRFIRSQTGDVLTLWYPFSDTVLNQTVDVFAGCDHSLATCNSKFSNKDNFGGFAFVPLQDIFRKGID